jgi:hypothetical protein
MYWILIGSSDMSCDCVGLGSDMSGPKLISGFGVVSVFDLHPVRIMISDIRITANFFILLSNPVPWFNDITLQTI